MSMSTYFHSVPNSNFVMPSSLSEAQERQIVLREELYKIRAQINDSLRQEKLGLDHEAYNQWRKKASHARSVKSTQLSRIQRWIQDQRAVRASVEFDANDPDLMLAKLLDLVDAITSANRIPLSSDQQDFLALTRKMVNSIAFEDGEP